MRHLPFAAFALVLIATFAACSDDESSSSTTKTCCINGEFYDCSQSAKMCTDTDHTCARVSSRDSECK